MCSAGVRREPARAARDRLHGHRRTPTQYMRRWLLVVAERVAMGHTEMAKQWVNSTVRRSMMSVTGVAPGMAGHQN